MPRIINFTESTIEIYDDDVLVSDEQLLQERRNLIHKKYRKSYISNPSVWKSRTYQRRALQKEGGTHTVGDIRAQLKRQKGRCYYAACGHCKLGDKYHVEHVVPLSRDGWNDPSNIVISCPDCNRHKSDKLPHEWPEGGRLL